VPRRSALGRVVLDHLRWVLESRELPSPTCRHEHPARRLHGGRRSFAPRVVARAVCRAVVRLAPGRVRTLLSLQALSSEGVGALRNGALVRWLEVSPINPLIYDAEGAETIARAFTSIVGRLPDDRQSIQLVAQASPLFSALRVGPRARQVHSSGVRGTRPVVPTSWPSRSNASDSHRNSRSETHSEALDALDIRYFSS